MYYNSNNSLIESINKLAHSSIGVNSMTYNQLPTLSLFNLKFFLENINSLSLRIPSNYYR